MTAPTTVQEALKEMQLARLKKKKNSPKDYPAFYAKLPFQVERKKQYAMHRTKVQALKDANEVLAIAEITGEGLEQAKHDQAVAALVVERSVPPRRGASAAAGLSGAQS